METIVICGSREVVGHNAPEGYGGPVTSEYVKAVSAVLDAACLDWVTDVLPRNWRGGKYYAGGQVFGGYGKRWLVHPHSQPTSAVKEVLEAADDAGTSARAALISLINARAIAEKYSKRT